MDDLYRFEWLVACRGYEWRDSSRGRILIYVDPPGDQVYSRERHEPLWEHSGLFRTFADLDPTEDAILAFANEHGLLGWDSMKQDWESSDFGESLASWVKEIAEMKSAVELWDAIRFYNEEILRRHVDADQGVSGLRPLVESRAYSTLLHVPLGGEFRTVLRNPVTVSMMSNAGREPALRTPGDHIKGPALVLLEAMVNDRIREGVAVELHYSERLHRPALFMQPQNLLGALWVQLARSIERSAQYRRCACAMCANWFEIGVGRHARSDKMYCSSRCRGRVFRSK